MWHGDNATEKLIGLAFHHLLCVSVWVRWREGGREGGVLCVAVGVIDCI